MINIPDPKYLGLVDCQAQDNINLANILGLRSRVSGELVRPKELEHYQVLRLYT
jgi:hypothetical protein